VELALGCNVGEDLSFDAIRGRHDAVLIATGVYKSREIEARRAGARHSCAPSIISPPRTASSSATRWPEFDSGELDAAGKRVVVIGGGDTGHGLRAAPPSAGRRPA
jgi:glutamate synthase (NADPH/NADH) small chain